MNKNMIHLKVFLLLMLSLFAACSKTSDLLNQAVQDNSAANGVAVRASRSMMSDSVNVSVSVFASDIAFPRGLKFGPDGYLYVALAGFGGTDSTTGQCTQVIPPIGPYKE